MSAPRGTVLVPLDGSKLADGVLGHVERLLGREPYDIALLTVVAPEGRDERAPARLQGERAAAEAHLAQVRERLQGAGATVTAELREGDAAAEILSAVDALRPALVAMSSHGRTGVLRWLRGSVAERVLRSCPAPLLLVTPRVAEQAEPGFRRILVPLDGSERAAAVLPLVEDLAARHASEVLLLLVRGLERPLEPAVSRSAEPVEPLRSITARLGQRGIAVRALEAFGAPVLEILDAAEREEVDLIALATHGRSGVARAVVGSVSEAVLRHARRPVLVVRSA